MFLFRARQKEHCAQQNILLKNLGLKKKEIEEVKKLYGASVSDFLEVVTNIKDKYKNIVLFSHNPGITEFANTLTSVHIDNMPTCSMFAVQADTDKWADFLQSEKKFLFFDYPKNPLEGL